jgi:hypothetical protein
MQYARVWHVNKEGERGSDEFQFSDSFLDDAQMQEWAEEIAERNDAQLDYWEEISKEEFMEATGS